MAINETLIVTASFTRDSGARLSKSSEKLTIIDTSSHDVVININKDWKTPSNDAKYGSLFIKPTVNVYDEMIASGIPLFDGMTVVVNIDPDVAVIGDDVSVGAIHADRRIPSNTLITVNNKGLLLGRGGRPAIGDIRHARFNITPEKGGAGGPALVCLNGNMNIINTGGIAGGAGGAGINGSYYSPLVATAPKSAFTVMDSGYSAPGGGAPFGLRTSSGHSLEIYSYLNKSVIASIESGLNAYMKSFAGEGSYASKNACEYILAYINLETNKLTGYFSYPGRTRQATLNETIIIPDTIKQIYVQGSTNGDGNADYGGVYVGTFIPTTDSGVIGPLNIATQYDSNWKIRKYYGKGATAPVATHAGLFKGGLGSSFDLSLDHGRVMLPLALMCMDQATVNTYAPQFRGAPGGNLGAKGGDGVMPPAITIKYGYNGSADYVNIEQGHTGGTPKTVQPSTGGDAGATTIGNVFVENSNGGVAGGAGVIAKYDPNGTFDALARAGNPTKTFEPRYIASA